MNDIFKNMQTKVGCAYISDLPSYKRRVWHEMKRLNPADYEERPKFGFVRCGEIHYAGDPRIAFQKIL